MGDPTKDAEEAVEAALPHVRGPFALDDQRRIIGADGTPLFQAMGACPEEIWFVVASYLPLEARRKRKLRERERRRKYWSEYQRAYRARKKEAAAKRGGGDAQ